jgi:hypothetical protein
VSIRADKLPPAQTLLGVIDVGARKAVALAQEEVAPVVAREVPRKSGKTAAALRPRVSRTATGAALSVRAPRGKLHGHVTIAEVVRWVNRGTGLYRTAGLYVQPARLIRSSRRPLPGRMTLPGGAKRWTVKGQHPNPFMARILSLGTPRVQSAAERGAKDAARAVERLVG